MPWAWVGPPTTTRSVPSRSSGDACSTGTTITSAFGRRPSAMASAIRWVLPYIDS
jgi:hypothetical protein